MAAARLDTGLLLVTRNVIENDIFPTAFPHEHKDLDQITPLHQKGILKWSMLARM